MLGEISQYSDVHHQQFNDYGSVQKLMKAFFDSMVESKNVPRRVPATIFPQLTLFSFYFRDS